MIRKKILLIVLIVFLLNACSMYRNFTTYFNRFYIANEQYTEIEKTILAEKSYLFEFKRDVPISKVQEPLNKVIEMCSKIMQYNAQSSYVKDAIFITGKAFYYQHNFLKAERKFAEIIAFDDPNFNLQAKLWLGKTNLQMNENELGLSLINQVIDTAKILEENELASEALQVKISYYLHYKDYENAVKYCEELVSVAEDDELIAEVFYEVGKIHLLTKNNIMALKAFDKVNDYSPKPETEFNSYMEVARLKYKTGAHDDALEALDDLKRNSKYQKYLGNIELELGNVYFSLEEYEKAFNIYTYVDTLYSKIDAGGIASFMKAKIYDKTNNLDSALVYYSKVTPRTAPKEYKDTSQQRMKSLKIYSDLKKNYNDLITQKRYSLDTLEFKQDFTKYLELRSEDSLKMVREFELNKNRVDTMMIMGTMNFKYSNKIPVFKKMKPDTLQKLIVKKKYEIGNYFFTEETIIDSASYYFSMVMKEMPDSIKTSKIYYTLASFYGIANEKELSDSLFNIVYEKFKHDPLANEAARRLNKEVYIAESDKAKELFDEVEDLILKKEYDKSIPKLKVIWKDYPKSPYSVKSLYTLGWLYENEIKNVDSMMVYYDSLVTKYASSDYAKDALPKYNLIKSEKQKLIEEAKAKELEKKKEAEVKTDTTQNDKSNEEKVIDRRKLIDDERVPTDSLRNSQKDSLILQQQNIRNQRRNNSVKQDTTKRHIEEK